MNMQLLGYLMLFAVLSFGLPASSALQGPLNKQSTTALAPTKGQIEQGVYKNPWLGIEFTPPKGFHFKPPEEMGPAGTTPMFYYVQAETERGPGYAQMVFYADPFAYHPRQQLDDTSYLKLAISTNEKSSGFRHVDGEKSAELSGVPFLRADFVAQTAPFTHEAVLVKTHDNYAWVFIFTASDFVSVNKLIASTALRITR